MKKLLCLCVLSAILLSSCSSSDSSSESITESNVLVTKVIETYANDNSVVTTNYTYNGKKLVTSVDSDGYYEKYFYTGDLITSLEYYDASDALLQTETFTYNGNNQLTSYTRIEFDFDSGQKELYTYNGNGTVSIETYNGDATTQDELTSTGVATFANGEVSQIVTTDVVMDETTTRVYTYDAKLNPFKNVIGVDKITIVESEAIGITHNIVTEVATYPFSGETTTTTYTYNELNFPLTSSEIVDTDATSVIASQYFYNN